MSYTVDHYQIVDDENGEKTLRLLGSSTETRMPKWVLTTEVDLINDGMIISRWYGLHLYVIVKDKHVQGSTAAAPRARTKVVHRHRQAQQGSSGNVL